MNYLSINILIINKIIIQNICFCLFVQVLVLFFLNPLMADERKTVYVFPPSLIGDSTPDLAKSLDDALRKELNKLHDLVHNPSYEDATINFFSRQSDQALDQLLMVTAERFVWTASEI